MTYSLARSRFFLLLFAPKIDVEVGHLLVERRAGEAEGLGGPRFYAPRSSQRRFDLGALERVDLARQRRPRRGRWLAWRVVERRGPFVGADWPGRARRAQHQRPLDHVAQLADVPRPAPAAQGRQRVGGDARIPAAH